MTLKVNSFVLGSCFDEKRGLFAFGDNSVDHTITDTPYSEYVHEVGAPRQYHANAKYRDEKHNFKFDHFSAEDRAVFCELAVRITRGWILAFTDIETSGAWVHDLVAAGAKRRTTLIWTKRNAAPKFTGDGAANASEAIVSAWAGTGRSEWNAGGSYGHYHFSVDQRDRRHKTQKPLPLMRQLIIDFTLPGDLILDPFAGGGSTLIAAKQLHRNYIGYELGGDADTLESYHRGQEFLKLVVPQTPMQQMMLHKERKKRAYAGHPVKETALHVQMLADLVPRRRARSLDDIKPARVIRRARSLEGL